MLLRPSMGSLTRKIWFITVCTDLNPHAATKMESRIKGAHARNTWPPLYMSSALPSLFGSSGKRQLSFGCQYRRKITVQMIEARDERISGSSGPIKLADKNCTSAKEPPETMQAGQTSMPFFQPA